jgi:hypothetical protein
MQVCNIVAQHMFDVGAGQASAAPTVSAALAPYVSSVPDDRLTRRVCAAVRGANRGLRLRPLHRVRQEPVGMLHILGLPQDGERTGD